VINLYRNLPVITKARPPIRQWRRTRGGENRGVELGSDRWGSYVNDWTHCELAFPTQDGDLTQGGTLELDGRETPVESITKALRERFMERRKKTLAKKLTERLVADAGRKRSR
jgi:hypothetical protein